MSASKFLYLTRPEWVTTWIAGGTVPLNLASAYRSNERQGTMTPDEVRHSELHGISERDFERIVKIGPNAAASISIGKVVIDGKVRGRDVSFVRQDKDGLILCLSNSFSPATLERLQKTACVEIPDWRRLLVAIDEQLGVSGMGRPVEYTNSSDRKQFLKSVDDAWQDEFRLFWPVSSSTTVTIHSNLAVSKHDGAWTLHPTAGKVFL